ncbi:MAG: hypothetical protein PVF70_01070 [Anaerolineales bacterium]|jgi:hypothetical protein
MGRTLIGVFLILHGLVHAGLAAAPIPNDPEPKPGAFFTAPARTWLLSSLGLGEKAIRTTGIVLVALATLGFVLAGMGVLGVPLLAGIWRGMAIGSAIVSALLLIAFWHSWLILGVLLDVAILVALLWLQWPPESLIGR